jgi:UDP:flavonoid glycosyltransferase YjiC (YdhE family)
MPNSLPLDVVFVADPRFQGGASTALAAEMEACARAGLAFGLLAVKGPVLRLPWPFHAGVRRFIADGRCRVVDPGERVSARFALVHHPTVFANVPDRPVRIDCDHLVLVLHHPAVDGLGAPEYDLSAIVDTMALVFGRPPILAPVGPAVRRSLDGIAIRGAPLLPDDWLNLVDVDAWPGRRRDTPGAPLLIGRHSRPSPLKFPDDRDTALAVYPDDPGIRVRMLGADRAELERLYGAPLPRGWDLLPFGAEAPEDFLASLDVYVYYHGHAWVEAFGRSILEALAAGLPTVLPPHFEDLFGPAALYARPHETRAVIDELAADPAAFRLQGARGRSIAADRFGLHRFLPQLAAIGPVAPARPAVRAPPPKARVMMITSNGVGLGHLTRLLAIAKRLPPDVEPVFYTLSQAMPLVVEAGYLAEFVPHHRYLGLDAAPWNRVLFEELSDAIGFYRPRTVVFDGTMPYGGLTEVAQSRPEISWIWLRGAMLTAGHKGGVDRARYFDAVIEPGEIAEAFDLGPTAAHREKCFRVGPVLLVDPADRLDRAAARARLGLPDDAVAVGVQLGAGNNFDMEPTRRAVIERLLRDPGTHVVEIVSPIAEAARDSLGPRHRVVALYPSFPVSRAFDFMVSAAGYNSFHEAIMGAIPTLFVPNQAGEMDLQVVRAQFAETAGCAVMMRTGDSYSVGDAVSELLQDHVRRRIEARCAALAPPNGAGHAAAFVADHCRLIRTDRDARRRYSS